MILDSSVFPLSTGGGNVNLAGFEWSEKTTDFTAEANNAYYCDTALNPILVTLPVSPTIGTEILLFSIGANSVRITTGNLVRGSLLLTDYAKSFIANYSIIKFEFIGGSTGWDWNTMFNSLLSDTYIGSGINVAYVNTPVNNEIPLIRNTNNSDVFYLLGTTNLFPGSTPSAFINPADRGLITMSASANSANAKRICDNNLFNSNWSAGASGTQWVKIQFNNGVKLSPTRYAINNSNWANSLQSFILQGSNDDVNWTNLNSSNGLNTNVSTRDWFTSSDFLSDFYTYIRLQCVHSSFSTIVIELCLWGIVSQS